VADATDVEVLERRTVDVVVEERVLVGAVVVVVDVSAVDVEVDLRFRVAVVTGDVGRTTVGRGPVRRGVVCSVTGSALRGDDTASGRTST
jgi:hypothetical protein